MSDLAELPARRRSKTREALIRAGQTLFASRAVESVSVDEIVAAAEVAKGSFYNHFADKEALADEVSAEVRKGLQIMATQFSGESADPAERIARTICGFLRQASIDPLAVRLTVRLFRGAAVPDVPVVGGAPADIKAGLASGRFTGLSFEAAVLMTIGIVQMGVERILDHQAKAGAAALARELSFAALRGLGLESASAKTLANRAATEVFTAP